MAKVKLTNPTSNVDDIELEVGHAEKLLRMENNGGWEIASKEPYTFTKENGITRKYKGAVQGSQEQK